MWYCETCEKHMKTNSKSSHIKLTAHVKKITTWETLLTLLRKKCVFDDTDVYHLDKQIEEIFEECMQ